MSSTVKLATPLGDEKAVLLQRLVDGLDASSLTWLSGYFAGLAARPSAAAPLLAPASASPGAQASPQETVTLVYGTQTGNSRQLAERLRKQLEAAGVAVRAFRAGEYPVRELKNERLLYVVISTQGDGEPPDDARGFFDFLMSKRAPALGQLRFAVLSLGDSSYPKYCEVGRVLDERLAQLGAARLFARADCDLDFEPTATPWLAQALEKARAELGAPATQATVTALRPEAPPPTFSRENPYPAQVLANQRITGRDALKDVRHLELSLEGSGLSYAPGDALGVVARNPPQLVDAVLSTLRLDGATSVTREGRTQPLAQWLTEGLEITKLSRPFLALHAERSGAAALKALLTPEGGGALRELLASHQVIDLLRAHPATWSAEELVAGLRRLTPRLYSIASSQKRVGDEVHLTVARVDYEAFGSRHVGAASDYLATRAADAMGVQRYDTYMAKYGFGQKTGIDLAGEIEDRYGVAVDAVCVGDRAPDRDTEVIVAAAREALSNAVRHGAPPVSLYVEAGEESLEVFVRDHGPGFDLDAIAEDRHGVRESIIARMERHGGSARVRRMSTGTEVALTLPERAH